MRTLVACLVALGLAGCGQGDDQTAVRHVAAGFVTAYEAHSGGRACALLSEDTRAALVQEEGEACADAVTGLKLDGGAVTRVDVEITNARVVLSSGESAFLSRTPNGWRLSALGCRPKTNPPAPADRVPLDCELEA
jgi:hypothetical protein